MKVLLTGANGFVGSSILDLLVERGHDVRIMLRKTSDTSRITRHLPRADVRYGSLDDPDALGQAVRDVECVVHCAGKTKVLCVEEYYAANRDGTRRVVEAANANADSLRHFVHISSRAVNGPTTTARPARENDPCLPISDYGKSKLEGERVVTGQCRVPWTVLRPSAVYGPGDTDFLHAFRAVRMRLMPLFDGGRQEINLVYVRDVAEAVLRCTGEEKAFGKTYNVASPDSSTARELVEEIARQMNVRALPLWLPGVALWPVCLVSEAASRVTGKPSILSRQKFQELRATGWVCSVERIRQDLGFVAATPLPEGIRRTLAWYREAGWL